MIRTSPTHYITPSSISITPNANGSANDLAVYIQDGTKIKVYSRRAGIDYVNGIAQEWTLTGRNRRLGDSGKPYTIYARLDKTDKDNAYLVFAPKVQWSDSWLDKYPYVSTDSATDTNKVAVPTEEVEYSLRNYYYVRLGDVSLPENGQREVSFDTGVLGTDQFNTEWALNPDSLPLRIELSCTIDDEDAGPTPYVYWDKSLVLTATLVEGWTGTDIQRFDHWEITRNTGISGDDTTWPSQARREAFASSGQIMLNHTKGSDDDFNAAVATTFIITAMGHSEDPESQALVTLATASIVILAETVEKYEMSFSTGIVSYNPQTESYTPTTGVAVRFRATDQRGDVFMLTRQQYDDAGLSVVYATVGSSSWTTVTPTGAAASEATVVIPVAAFASQQSVNVRLLNADGEELASGTIAFVRDGEDSKEREWIFLRSAEVIVFGDATHPYPSNISYGEVDPAGAAGHVTDNKNQDGWVPEGWWDEMQGADEEYPYEYGAYRDFVHDDTNGDHWGPFTRPKIWSHYAKDGKDGKSVATLVLDRTLLTVKTDSDHRVLYDVNVAIPFSAMLGNESLRILETIVDEEGQIYYITLGNVIHSTSDDVVYENRSVDIGEHGYLQDRGIVLDDSFYLAQTVMYVTIPKGVVLDEHLARVSVVCTDADDNEYQCADVLEITGVAIGEPGTDGYNTAVVTLYQRYTPTEQNPTPALPMGPMTYDFATGILSAADASYFNGWSQTPPNATENTKLFATQVSARSRQATDEILPNEWTSPIEIVLDGKDGKNAVRMDIDNEADMVQTDSTGHVTATRQIITTVRLFDGEDLQSIYLTSNNITGINVGTGTNLLPAITTAPDGKGKVLTWSFNTSMTLQDHYNITISYTYNGKAHSTVFTLASSKGLAIFQLKPGMSAIPFAYSGGAYTPPSRMLTLKVVKTDSGVDSEMEASDYGLSLIRYSFDAMPTSKTAGTAWPGNSGVEVSRSGVSNVFIALFNSDGVRLDQESVPVVKDGVEGAAGAKSAMVIIYKRSADQPGDTDRPSGNTVYDFSAGTLTPAQGVDMKNWSLQIPAVDSSNPQPCWTRQATALSATGTDTIGSSEWSGDSNGKAQKFVENGLAGSDAVNVVVSPASLIVNQSLQNTSNLDSLSEQILFSVMKGTTAKTVTKIDNIVVETDAAHNNRSKIAVSGSNSYYATLTAILKNADTNGRYYDRAYFTCRVAYTDGGGTKYIEGVKVEVYANLLGDWKETVEADTKREIANSTWFDVDDDPASPTYGEIVESDRLGTFIRSSKENTSRLEESNYINLFTGTNPSFPVSFSLTSDSITKYGTSYRLSLAVESSYENLTIQVKNSDNTAIATYNNVNDFLEESLTLNTAGTYQITCDKTATIIGIGVYSATTDKYSEIKQTVDGISTTVKGILPSKNLLSGVLSGTGWKSATSAVVGQGIPVTEHNATLGTDGYITAYEGDSYIIGYTSISAYTQYTLSFYSKTTARIKVTVFDPSYPSAAYQTFYIEAAASDSVRRTLSFQVGFGGGTRGISIESTSIIYPQLEEGTSATGFVASDTEISSQIIQTADSIDLKIKNDYTSAGITISVDGSDSKIVLDAAKVLITTNDTPAAMFENGKIKADYIDAKVIKASSVSGSEFSFASGTILKNLTVRGTIYASAGEFTGKVTATSGSLESVTVGPVSGNHLLIGSGEIKGYMGDELGMTIGWSSGYPRIALDSEDNSIYTTLTDRAISIHKTDYTSGVDGYNLSLQSNLIWFNHYLDDVGHQFHVAIEDKKLIMTASTISSASASRSIWPQISDNDQFGNITTKGMVYAVPWGYMISQYPSTKNKWAYLMVKVDD